MGAAVGSREDFGSGRLRALARTVKDAGQARRLLALAVIYDGGRRTEAARIGGAGLQTGRDNWLSNSIFQSYDDIVTLCCETWNKLIKRPWKITSIGMREWAHGV